MMPESGGEEDEEMERAIEVQGMRPWDADMWGDPIAEADPYELNDLWGGAPPPPGGGPTEDPFANCILSRPPIDWDWFAAYISQLIQQAGANSFVLPGALRVFNRVAGTAPRHVIEAMRNGTRFFDAAIYFALAIAHRPRVLQGRESPVGPERMNRETCTQLVRAALFLLIRGHNCQTNAC
jgi:hypothetical protein